MPGKFSGPNFLKIELNFVFAIHHPNAALLGPRLIKIGDVQPPLFYRDDGLAAVIPRQQFVFNRFDFNRNFQFSRTVWDKRQVDGDGFRIPLDLVFTDCSGLLRGGGRPQLTRLVNPFSGPIFE